MSTTSFAANAELQKHLYWLTNPCVSAFRPVGERAYRKLNTFCWQCGQFGTAGPCEDLYQAWQGGRAFRLHVSNGLMSESGQKRKSSAGLGMSALGGKADFDFERLDVCL